MKNEWTTHQLNGVDERSVALKNLPERIEPEIENLDIPTDVTFIKCQSEPFAPRLGCLVGNLYDDVTGVKVATFPGIDWLCGEGLHEHEAVGDLLDRLAFWLHANQLNAEVPDLSSEPKAFFEISVLPSASFAWSARRISGSGAGILGDSGGLRRPHQFPGGSEVK